MGEDLRGCVASDGGGRCASTCATHWVCPEYLVSNFYYTFQNESSNSRFVYYLITIKSLCLI